MAEAAGLAATAALPSTHGRFSASREAVARRAGHATIVGLVAIGVVALAALMVPLAVAFAGNVFSSTPTEAAQMQGPPSNLRAAASAPSGWADSYAAAVPSASDRGAALIAGAQQQQTIDTLLNIYKWAETEKAYQAQQAANAARSAAVPPRGTSATLGRASGYAPGTRLYARITMYGCVGSGGGFCGGMASGITVFEGAAACSSDMPFGTKFTIEGSDGADVRVPRPGPPRLALGGRLLLQHGGRVRLGGVPGRDARQHHYRELTEGNNGRRQGRVRDPPLPFVRVRTGTALRLEGSRLLRAAWASRLRRDSALRSE